MDRGAWTVLGEHMTPGGQRNKKAVEGPDRLGTYLIIAVGSAPGLLLYDSSRKRDIVVIPDVCGGSGCLSFKTRGAGA